MGFALTLIFVKAVALDFGALRVAKAGLMPALHLRRNLSQPNAAQPGDRAGEKLIDQLLPQSHGFKNLRPTIAIYRRDAHLRHNLQQPGFHGPHKVALGFGYSQLDFTRRNQILNRGQGQIRVNGVGPIANQAGQVMNFAHLAAFNHQADLHTLAAPHQVMVHRAHSQQTGNGRILLIDAQIAQDNDSFARVNRVFGHFTQPVERPAQAVGALGYRVTHRNRVVSKAWVTQTLQGHQVGVAQNRAGQFNQVSMFGCFFQQVRVRAQPDGQRHNKGFPQWVNRRVSYLGKTLLKVVEKGSGFLGHHRQGGVVAHRAGRLLAVVGHGPDDDDDLFVGITKSSLQVRQPLRSRVDLGRQRPGDKRFQREISRTGFRGQRFETLGPLLVGQPAGQLIFNLIVGQKKLPVQVHQNHLAGTQFALGHNRALIHIDHPRF